MKMPKVINQIFKLVVFSVLIFFCSGFTQSEDEPGGYMVDYLHERNLKTDKESLMEIVQSSEDIEVRWRAVAILGVKKATESKEVLKKLLNSEEDPFLIQSAAVALKRMGDSSGYSILKELFKSENNNSVKLEITRDLAEFFNDPIGKEFTLQMATSKSVSERIHSVQALGDILIILKNNEEELLPALDTFISFSKDPQWVIRREFVFVSPSQEPFLERIIPILKDLLENDQNSYVRNSAKNKLSYLEKLMINQVPNK